MLPCKSIAEEVLSFFLQPKLAKLKHEYSKLEEKCKIVRLKNFDQLHKTYF